MGYNRRVQDVRSAHVGCHCVLLCFINKKRFDTHRVLLQTESYCVSRTDNYSINNFVGSSIFSGSDLKIIRSCGSRIIEIMLLRVNTISRDLHSFSGNGFVCTLLPFKFR